MFARLKIQIWLIAIIAVFAALTGAFFDEHVAYAQGVDKDYVDVAVILQMSNHSSGGYRDVDVIVVNNGHRTAYDVEVVVSTEDPEADATALGDFAVDAIAHPFYRVPVGSAIASLQNGRRTFQWSIPALKGGQKVEYQAKVNQRKLLSPAEFDERRRPFEHFARVTTSSHDSNPANNTSRIWSFNSSFSGFVTYHNQATGNYKVTVTVDEPSPSPGDTVNFTITAIGQEGLGAELPSIDLQVDIELTDGLSVSGTPTYISANRLGEVGTTPSSLSYGDGVFNIGTLTSDYRDWNSVTLPVMVASGATVNQQCLTATLTGNPPPAPGRDDISDNVAEVCLGDQSAEPFVSGQVDAFTIYPCVGITTPPCDNTDDIRVRAVNSSSGRVLVPGTGLFRIDPSTARTYDAKTGHSVNDGNTVSWQTSVDPDRPYSGLEFGVELYYSRTPYMTTTGWGGLTFGIGARDVDGNIPPPGKVFLRSTSSGNEIRKAESPEYEELRAAPTGNSTPTTKLNYFLEFEKLGTYKFTWHAVAKRSSLHGSENCNPNTASPPANQVFCASETYTFHVGPMADLAVEDGGASYHAAADGNALTVFPVNHGPDESPSAQVTGLPTGAQVLHISQGTYAAGEWNIGELKVRDYYGSAGKPEPTLVLSASAGDTANVSIANSENYEVCVGPNDNPGNLAHTTQSDCEAVTNASWNSTPVYDYNTGNNTATITARAGTGGVGEGIPTLQVPAVHAPAVGVAWSQVESLYGVPVKDYQVQWSTNGVSGWTQLETDLTLPELFDITIQSGVTRHYRVRAVNEAGVSGPWSAPASPHMKPGRPESFTATGQSDRQATLMWTAPAGVTGITGYDLEFSKNGGENWTSLATAPTQTATSFTHTDTDLMMDSLVPTILRQYRVRTVATVEGSTVRSDWTTTVLTHPKPGAPGSFEAEGLNPRQAELTWAAPSNLNGATHSGYELEFSTDGGASWETLATPTSTPTALVSTTTSHTHTKNDLAANAARQYRLRTVGTVGSVEVESAWTYALASTEYPAPGAPQNFEARALDRTRVSLTWSAPESVTDVTHTGYQLEYSTDGNTWNWLPAGQTRTTLSKTTESHTHDAAVSPGAIRQYRLRAVGTTGSGNTLATFESGWVFASVTTQPVGPPQNLAATADGIGRIDLSWDAPAFGADRVTGYRIDHTPAGVENWQTREHGWRTSPRTYEHTGLDPGEEHCYRVAATYTDGAGPFTGKVCATTEGAPADLPGAPENLRVAQAGSNYVALEWDKPSAGGAVEYYEYRHDYGEAVAVTPRTATGVRVRGLTPGTSYAFQVRAGNSYGTGDWSQDIWVTLSRNVGVIESSPTELELEKGGSGSFNVRLKGTPTWPVMVYFHSIGPACLTDQLVYQQFKILLPDNPPPSKAFWDDVWWGPPEDRYALPYRAGVNVPIDASDCQGGETTVIEPIFNTVPFSQLESLPMWEELNLSEDEWREKWGVSPLEGVQGPSIKVTVVDGG